jgi:hypothetical protein
MPAKKTKESKKAKVGLTALEIFYQKSPEVMPQSQKAKQIHEIVFAVFKSIFNEKEGKKEKQMIKFREEFGGSMLTYAINRMLVKKDTLDIKAGLQARGCRILDSSENGLTCSKGALTMVLTLKLNNEEKALIDITC